VRDEDHRSALGLAIDRLQNRRFGACVDRGDGIVQNEDPRLPEQRLASAIRCF